MNNGKKRSYTSASANIDEPVRAPKRLKYNDNDNDNIIDLGLEYPALPRVLNCIKTEETLKLDSSFDLAQFAKSESMPLIFDWTKLQTAMHPIKLRREALKKQERSKYVKRDSMSNEQAADRRRRQNRESAKRTRERVRKYIAVLEMFYGHVQHVNSLLIKQLEVMAKYCSNKLSKEDMQKLKVMTLCVCVYFVFLHSVQTEKQIHEWPKQPTIEQCINVKPASISAIPSPIKQMDNEKQRRTESPKKNEVQSQSTEDASTNSSMPLLPSLSTLTLPPLNLSKPPKRIPNTSSIGNGDVDNLERIIQKLQSMHNSYNNRQLPQKSVNNMNSNNIINVLQQIQQIATQTPQIVLNPMHANTSNILALNPLNSFHTMQQFPNMNMNMPNQNIISLPNNILPVQLNMMMMNRQ